MIYEPLGFKGLWDVDLITLMSVLRRSLHYGKASIQSQTLFTMSKNYVLKLRIKEREKGRISHWNFKITDGGAGRDRTRLLRRLSINLVGSITRNDKISLAGWWSWTGSNRRHHACKACALPAELQPLTC